MSPPGKKSANVSPTRRQVSAAHLAAAWDNLSKAWKAQAELPKCGAKRRSDGGTCRNPALPNGRCRFHGGRTPKGKDWHKVQLVNPARSIELLEKKQAEVARRRARQEERRKAMTPEERAAHDEWHRTHRPASPAEREKARRDREARELLAGALGAAQEPQEGAGEAAAIGEQIARLEAARARLTAASDDDDNWPEVFR